MPRIEPQYLTREFVAQNVDAVCVDTCTYQRLDFAFEANVLDRLKLLNASHIKLLMVDLVEREVVAHLAAKVQENVAALRRAMRSARNYGLADSQGVEALSFPGFDHVSYARGRLEIFSADTNLEVIRTANHCNIERIIEDYFEMRPPFGKKKKSEFPDAFALGALENWAETFGRRVLIVSTDEDWLSFAATSDRLICGPSLTDLLATLPDSDMVMLGRAARAVTGDDFAIVRDAIERDFLGLPVEASADADHYVDIEVVDFGLSNLPSPNPNGSDFEVIANEPDELVVRWRVNASMWCKARARFDVRDPYDRDYVRMPPMHLRREVEVALEVLLTFDVVEDQGVQSVEFSTAEIVENSIRVDLGYVELDLSNEE